MFINNLTGKTIKGISFGGFLFSIPVGVSLCWDKFGDHIFKNAYPETGQGVNPVIRATASQWKGDRYVEVQRFAINAALIPNRADLIKLAKKYGVPAATIETWQEDESIGGDEIAGVINELDVPEHIKFPVPNAPVNTVVEDPADDLLKDQDPKKPEDNVDPEEVTTAPEKTVKDKTVVAAPKTGGNKKSASKNSKVAKRAPRTSVK